MLAILGYLQIYGVSDFLFQYKYIIGLLALVIPVFCKWYKSIKIYEYEYKTVLPIYFVKNPHYNYNAKRSGNKFIHSKIYIVDDEVAFVGSVNFTNSGFFKSYETCLMIENKETVIKLSEYFDELYKTDWMKADINYIGRKMYPEKIN